jgi:WD40 repeat protein
LRRLLLVLFALIAAAACTPSSPDNSTNNGARSNPPTLAAPAQFVEAQQAVTINNVAGLKYLGRLDQPGTSSTIFSATVSPDGTRLVALNNQQVLAWNLLTGGLLFQTARNDTTRVFYSSDKTEVYAIDSSGLVIVLDANTGAVKTNFPGNSTYSGSLAYSPDSGWLAVGGTDGTVKVWDTYQRKSLVTISAHTGAVLALAFSADENQLATGGADGLVRVWHWSDGKMVAQTQLDTPITIQSVAFAPDGSYVAAGTERDARLWSQSKTDQVYVLDTGRGGGGAVLKFSPDSRYLLAGNPSAGLSLWNLTNGKLSARLPDTQGETLAAAFSPDGNLLLTALLNGKVSLWNLVQISGQTINQANLQVGTQQIVDLDWTDDSRLLMFFDASGPIYLWGVGA